MNAALEDVLLEAAADEDEGLDFAAFQALLSVSSHDNLQSLEHYDARLGPASAYDWGSSADGSGHGAWAAAQRLASLSHWNV